MKLQPLRRKEVSKLLEQIDNEYNSNAKSLIDKYAFFLSEKNKVYVIDNAIKQVSLDGLRVNSLGLYFCEINNNNIRLSIEGSQIIGPKAKKNVLELDDKQAKQWMKGIDITTNKKFEGFVIIKNKSDFLGSGKYKEGRILNYVPKNRRIMVD